MIGKNRIKIAYENDMHVICHAAHQLNQLQTVAEYYKTIIIIIIMLLLLIVMNA